MVNGVDVSGRTDINAGAVFLGCAELPLMRTLQIASRSRTTLEDAMWLPLQRRQGPQVSLWVGAWVGVA
jgi:hypothetical protein